MDEYAKDHACEQGHRSRPGDYGRLLGWLQAGTRGELFVRRVLLSIPKDVITATKVICELLCTYLPVVPPPLDLDLSREGTDSQGSFA